MSGKRQVAWAKVLRAAKQNDKTAADVVREQEVSASTVSEACKTHGVKLRDGRTEAKRWYPSGRGQENVWFEQMEEAEASGESIRETAIRLRLPVDSVRYREMLFGVTLGRKRSVIDWDLELRTAKLNKTNIYEVALKTGVSASKVMDQCRKRSVRLPGMEVYGSGRRR